MSKQKIFRLLKAIALLGEDEEFIELIDKMPESRTIINMTFEGRDPVIDMVLNRLKKEYGDFNE